MSKSQATHVLLTIVTVVVMSVVSGIASYRLGYQKALNSTPSTPSPSLTPAIPTPSVVCTTDVFTCPDGTTVGRSGPNCEFDVCPPIPTANPNTQQACTMEALICPDGTAVGRSGPNCEFAPCPTQ